MKIVGRTIVDRRRNQRPKLPPITLTVDGRRYMTSDWTIGGFLVSAYTDHHRTGDTVTVVIRVDAGDGRRYEHHAEARVVRINKERRQLAAQFIELDAGAVETLDGWCSGRLRRRAARRKSA